MSSKKISLKAEKRKLLGRKVKQLRKQGVLPANVYGKKVKSQAVQVNLLDFTKIYQEAGETQLVELSITGEKTPRHVLFYNLHKDPVTDAFLHADFREVSLSEKIEAEIPMELTGEAPAISTGGVLVQLLNAVKVEALPNDLPEKFELNISKLAEIGHSLALKDLSFDKNKIKLLSEDENQLIVKIDAPTKEEEIPVEAPAEGEEGAEGETTEDEEKKEGESKEGETKTKEGESKDESKDKAKETAPIKGKTKEAKKAKK